VVHAALTQPIFNLKNQTKILQIATLSPLSSCIIRLSQLASHVEPQQQQQQWSKSRQQQQQQSNPKQSGSPQSNFSGPATLSQLSSPSGNCTDFPVA